MNFSDKIFINAYTSCSNDIKSILESTIIFDSVETLLYEQNITADTEVVSLTIGYEFLGLMDKVTTQKELTELGIPFSDIFLSKIHEKIGVKPAALFIYETDSNLESEIAEAEKTLAAMPGIRTMSGDIDSIRHDELVYKSNQEDLLTKPTTPTSHSLPSQGPRWDTQ